MRFHRPCAERDVFVAVENYTRNGCAEYWLSQAWCINCSADAVFDERCSADDAAHDAAQWRTRHGQACHLADQVLVGVDDAVLAQCRQCWSARTFTGDHALAAAERWQADHVAGSTYDVRYKRS